MQYIENYLTTQKAKLKVGHNKREYDTLVKALDIRTKQMLEGLNFEPETVRHYQLMGTADERKSELDAELIAAETCPAVMMPLALHTIMEDIRTRVKNDLLLSVHDCSFDCHSLSFRISTACFAMNFSESSKVSEDARIQKTLEDLKAQGYQIEHGRCRECVLRNCEKNQQLLEEYVHEKLGANVFRIISYSEEIDSIECSRSLRTQIYEFQNEIKEIKVPSDYLTKDEVFSLGKCIKDYISALHSYEAVGEKNMMLSLYRFYTHEIEGTLNYRGQVWQAVEDAHKQEREANLDIWSRKTEKGKEYVQSIGTHFDDYYGDIIRALSYHLKRIGLTVKCLSFAEHETIRLELNPACLYSVPELSDSLDGILDMDRNRIFKIRNSSKNLNKINAYMSTFLPKFRINNYSVKCEDCEYLCDISGFIHPVDIKTLLDSVKDIDPAILKKHRP